MKSFVCTEKPSSLPDSLSIFRTNLSENLASSAESLCSSIPTVQRDHKSLNEKSRVIKMSQIETLMRAPALGMNLHREYLDRVYTCMRYVRKHGYRAQIDDGRILEEIRDHIEIGKDPKPLTKLGHRLIKNGYFLIAYAILMGRIFHSAVLAEYLANCFMMYYEVTENEEDLLLGSKMLLSNQICMGEFDRQTVRMAKGDCNRNNKRKKHKYSELQLG